MVNDLTTRVNIFSKCKRPLAFTRVAKVDRYKLNNHVSASFQTDLLLTQLVFYPYYDH